MNIVIAISWRIVLSSIGGVEMRSEIEIRMLNRDHDVLTTHTSVPDPDLHGYLSTFHPHNGLRRVSGVVGLKLVQRWCGVNLLLNRCHTYFQKDTYG